MRNDPSPSPSPSLSPSPDAPAAQTFELLREPPSASHYLASDDFANFKFADGSSCLGRKYHGRRKGTTPVWAILPTFSIETIPG